MPISKSFTVSHNSDRSSVRSRLHLEKLLSSEAVQTLQQADRHTLIEGLTQTPKTLPPKYFYDDRGSILFEQICELPEYYPTRTEASILHVCAAEIARLTGPCELVELGSGSSTKTRILLDAYQQLGYSLRYIPVDVSGGILESSAYELLQEYPTLQIQGLVSTYELALQHLKPTTLPSRMIAFLGSTLGNLNPTESQQFFAQMTTALEPGEYILLGVDLQKPINILEAAYNDKQGITAAFNLNMLSHLNRQFEGDFDLTQFEHQAFYNSQLHQIEMHLRSRQDQSVKLDRLGLKIQFEKGETIRTEISRKFDLTTLQAELNSQGLKILHSWTDPNRWFGVLLCQFVEDNPNLSN
ncbi:MAG: L-histidine N(alpha)-methyltransferase [Microcoleaceae cyanobacterium]